MATAAPSDGLASHDLGPRIGGLAGLGSVPEPPDKIPTTPVVPPLAPLGARAD